MKKIPIAARILPSWQSELTQIMQATEAIGMYLKKASRLRVVSRLEAVEDSLTNVRAIVLALAEAQA
jgi:hypothetical protein